jgi:hypothetical protein
MSLWARLTWQAADAPATTAVIERRLGIPAAADGLGLIPGARVLDLGTALLEVRPWQREGPSDSPRWAGRLVLEPVPGGEPVPSSPHDDPPAVVLVGVGWSTVDLERTESELAMWLATDDPGDPRDRGDPPGDPHLGARVRARRTAGLPGDWMVLLEPTTEGRAAAALARDGEGPCALYLWPSHGLASWLADAPSRGVELRGGVRPGGPFGAQALLAGSPPAGPHVIVVDGRSPVSIAGAAGTISP